MKLTDATWDERFTVICLIVCIVVIGIAPMWISKLIEGGVGTVLANIN
jgi:NADH-quinone oxidoreductase subunit M